MAEKQQKKKAIISFAIVAIAICTIMTGMLVGKYIHEKDSDGAIRAKNFYFTSDLLDGKEHTLSPTLDAGGNTSITFSIGNHGDDLRYAEMDINYIVYLDDVEKQSGVLTKNQISDASVTIDGLQPGHSYNIKAVGTGGYTKTITATIVVPNKESKLYKYIDTSSSEYTLLTLWNEGDEVGTTTVEYSAIPDNTNPLMSDWTSAMGSHEVQINPHESIVLRFFGENRTVTVSDPNVIEKIPE